jgi:Beta-galactosidase
VLNGTLVDKSRRIFFRLAPNLRANPGPGLNPAPGPRSPRTPPVYHPKPVPPPTPPAAAARLRNVTFRTNITFCHNLGITGGGACSGKLSWPRCGAVRDGAVQPGCGARRGGLGVRRSRALHRLAHLGDPAGWTGSSTCWLRRDQRGPGHRHRVTPLWLVAAHPEILPVTADGRRLAPGARRPPPPSATRPSSSTSPGSAPVSCLPVIEQNDMWWRSTAPAHPARRTSCACSVLVLTARD